jgi:hypothetical protein
MNIRQKSADPPGGFLPWMLGCATELSKAHQNASGQRLLQEEGINLKGLSHESARILVRALLLLAYTKPTLPLIGCLYNDTTSVRKACREYRYKNNQIT